MFIYTHCKMHHVDDGACYAPCGNRCYKVAKKQVSTEKGEIVFFRNKTHGLKRLPR